MVAGCTRAVELPLGLPTPFSLGPVSSPTYYNGGSGYQVTTLSIPTRLEVRVTLTDPDLDVDVLIRYGEDVTTAPLYDCAVNRESSTSVPGTLLLVYKSPVCIGPPLRAGTYFIALRMNTTGAAVARGLITVVLDTTPQPLTQGRLVPSGAAASYSFGPVELPRLFNGEFSYAVDVPAGATSLKVDATTQLTTSVDLYVRQGQDVTRTSNAINADFRAEGSVAKTITIPSPSPGRYYIALRVVGNALMVSGTVTATVAATGATPATVLSNGIPAAFLFSGVPSPALVGNYRITAPGDVTRIVFTLVTTTAGANVDLYVRVGAEVTSVDVATRKSELPAGSIDTVEFGPATPFNPVQAGDYYVSLRIVTTGTAVAGTLTATVLTGVGPSIDLTPAIDFGNVTVGQSRDMLLTVRNLGTAVLTVNSITSSNAQFTAPLAAVPFPVAVAGQVSITLRFTPAAGGVQSGTVTIGSSDAGRPNAVMTVQGTGAGASANPAITIIRTLDFGAVSVGQARDLSLSARNTGGSTLTVTTISSSNPQFVVTSPARPFSVAAGAEQAITVRFAPTAAGAQSATLTLATNDPALPSVAVSVTGSGDAGGARIITVSATSLTFNAQAGVNPPSQTFTVRNSGGGTLNFSVLLSQPWLSASPTQGSVSGSAAATITIAANVSSLALGAYNGDVRVADNAGGVVIPVQLTVTAQTSCPAGPAATPAITPGGMVNAASLTRATLPGGAIARGSIFSIFGANMGPTSGVQVTSFPLGTTLGCVSVRVTRAGASVDAIPLFVRAGQINGIMPSNAPTGDAQITVTWNGRTSAAAAVRIVDTSFGIFTANSNGMGPGILENFVPETVPLPINSPRRPARPRQTVILWGTGLGPITAPDNVAPPFGDLPVAVEITVGGRPVTNKAYSGRGPCCAGLDQIVFEVPADAPPGCFVPVGVRAGGVTSNIVTMAIEPEGRACSDPANPLGTISTSGGRVGLVQLIRLLARLQLDASSGFTNVSLDLGVGSFTSSTGSEFAYNPLTSLPPGGELHCAERQRRPVGVAGRPVAGRCRRHADSQRRPGAVGHRTARDHAHTALDRCQRPVPEHSGGRHSADRTAAYAALPRCGRLHHSRAGRAGRGSVQRQPHRAAPGELDQPRFADDGDPVARGDAELRRG